MTQIEQIKAEIKRRIAGNSDAKARVLSEILILIDSLPQEQPSEDLAKEVESWMEEVPSVNLEWNNIADAMRDCARYFYELGKKKQKEQDEELLAIAHLDGVASGRKKEREQMMKDAIETTMVEGSLNNPTFVRRKIIIVNETGNEC